MKAADLLEELKHRLAAVAGQAVLWALYLTVDGEVENAAAAERARAGGRPVIYAFWHGRLMIPLWSHRGRGIGILISRSRDGEYVARVARRMGFHVMRGSSSRGGAESYRLLLDSLRDGRDIGITPDGPRGPRYEVKGGIVHLARQSGAAIIPVGLAADRARQLASWDEFRVVLPGAYVLGRCGEPVTVPPDAKKADMEAIRARLESDLRELTADVEARVGSMRKTKRQRARKRDL